MSIAISWWHARVTCVVLRECKAATSAAFVKTSATRRYLYFHTPPGLMYCPPPAPPSPLLPSSISLALSNCVKLGSCPLRTAGALPTLVRIGDLSSNPPSCQPPFEPAPPLLPLSPPTLVMYLCDSRRTTHDARCTVHGARCAVRGARYAS